LEKSREIIKKLQEEKAEWKQSAEEKTEALATLTEQHQQVSQTLNPDPYLWVICLF